MYFRVKSTLKSNRYCTFKYPESSRVNDHLDHLPCVSFKLTLAH